MSGPILEAKGLEKHFFAMKKGFLDSLLRTDVPIIRAVEVPHLSIEEGEVLAVVGESGSGKTTLGRLLVTLEEPTAGEIYFHGRKVEGRKAVMDLRRKVQMVFQNPADSLDPRMSIKNIVTEPLTTKGVSKREREGQFERALDLVGLDSSTFAERRPRDLSGGQRQRVAVARAVISSPEFIVLDEPTSALDASVQSQVLNLLARIHDQLGFTYLFITHNIAIARYIADVVAVMYAGQIVEIGPAQEVLSKPKHPYTQALFSSVPSLDKKEVTPPTGEVPSLIDLPTGCRFNPRCPYAMSVCKETEPPLIKIEEEEAACWLYK